MPITNSELQLCLCFRHCGSPTSTNDISAGLLQIGILSYGYSDPAKSRMRPPYSLKANKNTTRTAREATSMPATIAYSTIACPRLEARNRLFAEVSDAPGTSSILIECLWGRCVPPRLRNHGCVKNGLAVRLRPADGTTAAQAARPSTMPEFRSILEGRVTRRRR